MKSKYKPQEPQAEHPLMKVLANYKKGEGNQEEIDKIINEVRKQGLLYCMKMNRAQSDFIRIKNSYGRSPKRRLMELGNKAGKTRVGIAEDIAHAMGFRVWLQKDDPDYHIKIKVPNQGLIGCENMLESVPFKIEPELRALIPIHCAAEFKKNQTGVVKTVTIPYDYFGKPCGSVINIRSYNQDPSDFEGIDADWIHWDEPPPERILKAAERGKIVTNAPSWFTMTPLKEPYIYDLFSLKAFNNGGTDQETAVFRGSIWDNCQDWCKPCDVHIPENNPDNMPEWMDQRPVNKCPKCGLIMGFMPKAGIDEYLKTLDPEEREAREEGKWAHLSGLVYKELDRNLHVYEDFTIPSSWMRVEGIDPHDARPTHWLFGAVSPEEVEINGKQKNRIYFYDHLLLKGSVDDMVSQVKGMRAVHGYTTPAFVVLDKKFGEKTQMEERSWQTELERRGINRIRLSHSSPGDVELGHKIVKEYLKPHYSALLGGAKPGMLFARKGCGDKYGPSTSPIHYMFGYQYKEGKSNPEEKYKDWPDVVRYIAMEQPIHKSPENEKRLIDIINARNDTTIRHRRMAVNG